MSKDNTRRRQGEGSISRHHNGSCPPVVNGSRPDHTCTAGWRARVWVETMTGQKVRKVVYGRTQADVVKALKKLHADEDRKTVVGSTVTVETWLRTDAAEHGIKNYWTLNQGKWKVNTRKGYASKIGQYIIPNLGQYPLDRLTPDHVERMYDAMRAQGLAEATLRQTHMVLSRALKIAMRRGLVARNVCDLIDPPTTAVNKPQAPTVDEARAILRIAGEDPRWWLALLEGLRQGEALGLVWDDIHEDEDADLPPHLIVNQALSREPGVGLVTDKPKSDASTGRIVPLVKPVRDRLARLRATRFAQGAKGTDPVFWNERSHGPKDSRADWSEWTALLKFAGVPHYTLHSARSTTAQLLENAGVSDRIVAEILGHAEVKMTHHYQQGNVAAKRLAMRALDTYWADEDGPEGSAQTA